MAGDDVTPTPTRPPFLMSSLRARTERVDLTVECPSRKCSAPVGSPCTMDGVECKPHHARLRMGALAHYERQEAAWRASPEYAAEVEKTRREYMEQVAKRAQREAAHAEKKANREEDAKQQRSAATAAVRAEWVANGDTRTMRERVRDYLVTCPDGASAFAVACGLGIKDTSMLSSVHLALTKLVRSGEATRERVECFVSHRFSGGMSSVYRPVPLQPSDG